MGLESHWWLIAILVIVLMVMGPGKLPQIGGAIGGAIKEFRESMKGSTETSKEPASTKEEVDQPGRPGKEASAGP
jgi:sec-independent protein translocase protein TatA